MIGKYLNLKGDSLIAVCIPRETPEQSEKLFTEVCKAVMDVLDPLIQDNIKKQDIQQRAHDCKTIEEVEALNYNMFPEDFFEKLADELNKRTDLKDSERMFVFMQVADRVIFSLKQWFDTQLRQRCQRIADGKRTQSKIIV